MLSDGNRILRMVWFVVFVWCILDKVCDMFRFGFG